MRLLLFSASIIPSDSCQVFLESHSSASVLKQLNEHPSLVLGQKTVDCRLTCALDRPAGAASAAMGALNWTDRFRALAWRGRM